jgi:hypothetical protein
LLEFVGGQIWAWLNRNKFKAVSAHAPSHHGDE